MDRFSDGFNEYADVARAKTAVDDFDDLQHAIAGREVGRHRRHIQNGDIDPVTGGDKAKETIRRTLEWLLLNDENYARLYEGAKSAIREAAQSAQDVLDKILTAFGEVQTAIADVLDRAMELPDGRKVFRDKDGNVRDENGKIIADGLAAQIQWRGDEPTYEEYRALKDRAQTLEDAANEIRGIEVELGGMNERMDNDEEPPRSDELEGVTDRANSLRDRIEKIELGFDQSVQVPKADSAALENSESVDVPVVSLASKP